MQILVEDLDLAGALDVAGSDDGGATHVETQRDFLVGAGGDHDVLDVEDDVGDVLAHTLDDVELVQRIIEAHCGDGCTRDAGEQAPAQ